MTTTASIRSLSNLLAVLVTAVLGSVGAGAEIADSNIDFDAKIAPLLAARCLDCHSGTEPKGGLDLSRRERVRQGGDGGPALNTASPEKSLLWERVATDEMPPKKPLTGDEKQLLKSWINSGATWGTDPIDPYRATSAHRGGYDWWSLQPLSKVSFDATQANPLDRLVQDKLREKNLKPSPPADRRTLIRRVTFDLIGLPPTPAEVEAFVADSSPTAFATVVNRLLDSPHYGERWARHWLDVSHFGESDGFEYDRMRPNAWPYRDWVVDAFNRDLPYDQFARLQIAGDVLQPESADAITAAGFLVHGAHDALLPAGDIMKQIMRQDELEDVVGLVSQSFLGLTVHCARCHDHKFDPIKTEDYYRLASSLAGVRRGDRAVPPASIPEALTERLTSLRVEVRQLEAEAVERIHAARSDNDKRSTSPTPLLSWEFDTALDEAGETSLKLVGEAKLIDGALLLDGKQAFAASPTIAKEIREKTLEAWVQLANLDQRGGGVISLQSPDGATFDAIVFGERDASQWMAGSDGFQRFQTFAAPKESAAVSEFVHIAIAYTNDGVITAYRNGEVYGKPYKSSGLHVFAENGAQLVFGIRHTPVGGNKMLAGKIARAALHDRALTANEVSLSAASAGNIITRSLIVKALAMPEAVRHAQLLSEINALDARLAKARNPEVFTIKPLQPESPTHVLLRGNPLHLGAVVAPGGLSGLKVISNAFELPPTAPEGERRRKLAEWITQPSNPLFARTIVNRLWHYHFGRGLIETPNDLGFNGGQPSHPELLDYLANDLIEHGWSLKHVHRQMVLSQAYQQASLPREECLKIDRDNRLLWRFSPHRLEAESVRDAVLSLAGQLNPALGGPSFQDFRAYDNHNAQYYEPADPVGPEFNRRSIYRMGARGGKSPLLDTLDCPDPSITTPKRGSTTTPLQALALLNNSFMLRMADHMGERLHREAGSEISSQIDLALQLAYARPPQAEESRLAIEFIQTNGLAPFCRVLLNTNGFLYVD